MHSSSCSFNSIHSLAEGSGHMVPSMLASLPVLSNPLSAFRCHQRQTSQLFSLSNSMLWRPQWTNNALIQAPRPCLVTDYITDTHHPATHHSQTSLTWPRHLIDSEGGGCDASRSVRYMSDMHHCCCWSVHLTVLCALNSCVSFTFIMYVL